MANKINDIKRSALVYVKDIGKGAFSTVYKMTWESPEGPIDVAVKKLNSKDRHELEVLSALSHPNIVKLIGVVDEGIDFMLVLELCEGGSLRSYLQARNGNRLSGKQFYDWAEQAARPLEYLRENKVVHKDVKSDNYMVTSQDTLKLGDFGLAKNINHTMSSATSKATYGWMAPELLLEGILSPKYDIFALAVVLWELWTLKYPWEGIEPQVIAWRVCNEDKRLPLPDDCPKPIKDLLRRSWEADWKQRPDIIEVLQVITAAAAQGATAQTVDDRLAAAVTLTVRQKQVKSAAAAAQAQGSTVQTVDDRLAAAVTLTARQRQILAGPWDKVREFGKQDGPGKLEYACHITLSPMGDVVIANIGVSQIIIYSIDGEYKSSIHTQSQPCQIAVSSDNTCFMTDRSQHITMYELGGKYKGKWAASSGATCLYGLAIDYAGDLLLGDIWNKYIYKYTHNGIQVESIKVGIQPYNIGVTSHGTIVIADYDTAPLVISNTGEVLLKLPVVKSLWHQYNVYCHDGVILVCRPGSILCYSESGNYLGSIPLPYLNPFAWVVMTSDSKTLLVCEAESVKVFTIPSVQQQSLASQ